ncbi:Dynamin-1-like protein [Homalodisca vitripennis]|nr:Dynamin-1-like protein [Homalodisca vitripennis]
MDELIDTINQLQDVFLATGSQGLDLPQIVVVGAQSSGKSSVLEHLVGKSFLPRGPGVVTRCPLVLRLQRAQGSLQEYAIFQHDKTRVFTDSEMITREIEEQTSRLAGGRRGICSVPILLRLYSSSFLNLTMVDLPGLTKVPVGDQPADIERQTRDLTLKYIQNPNCIILAVTPANADMATSESLKIAREVDPEGARTLAVVTKLDLMDDGTDAVDILTGRVIPVKLGIIGIVNRSQKDIMEGKSIMQNLKEEAEFFYKKYRSICELHGSVYLTKTVQALLINHIKNCLPKLRERINQKLASQKSELEVLGDAKTDRPTLLLDLMTKFSNSYCAAINGDLSNIQTNELYGGARINYVFQESLNTTLKSIDALAGLSKGAILTAMQNASGVNPTLFVPEVAFELLVKRQIKRLRSPCIQCVDLIHEELCRIVQHCVEDQDSGLRRFPKLQREISEVVSELLRSRMPITNQMVDHFIDIQLAYVNTGHPDFLPNWAPSMQLATVQSNRSDSDFLDRKKSSSSIKFAEEDLQPLRSLSQDPPMDKSAKHCILIQELIQSYFSIVRKSVQDIVPKTIMHFLVNYVLDHLQSELVAKLYRRDASDLLQESVIVVERRKEVKAAISALEKAHSILNMLKPAKNSVTYHISKSDVQFSSLV